MPNSFGESKLKALGAKGEQYACDFLSSEYFTILERNAYSRWGELDIIAEKNGRIHFVEVKTRTSKTHGAPYEAITKRKLAHLTRTIKYYIIEHRLQNRKFQLDVITIQMNGKYEVLDLRLYENLQIDRYY